MAVKPLKWEKDPDEVLDFVIDWGTNILSADDDEIDTSTWIVPDGITMDDASETTVRTTIWLSGGTLGEKYTIVNRVTTTDGRTHDQTAILTVKNH